MSEQRLPDFKDPPVTEVVAAVQFVPLAQFGMPEVISVARAFEGWTIVDVPPAIPPIVESPPNQAAHQGINFTLGPPPLRVILSQGDRWLAQVQQDRIAAH